MSKTRFLYGTALRSFTALSLVAGVSMPAFAQETQQEKAKSSPDQLKSEQEIKSGTSVCPPGTVHPNVPGSVACVPVTPAARAPATTSVANNAAITITGSRIKRPNLESPVPVTSVGGEEFFQTGNVSVGDYLNNL